MDEGTLGADKLHKARLCERRTFFPLRVGTTEATVEKITEKTCTISFSLRVRPLSRFRGTECVLNIENPETDYPSTPGPSEMLVWSREHAHARSIITF